MTVNDLLAATKLGKKAWQETRGLGTFNPQVFQSNLQAAMENPSSLCLALLLNDMPVGGIIAEEGSNWYTGQLVAHILFIYVDTDYRYGLQPFKMLFDEFHTWSHATRFICTNEFSPRAERLMRLMDYYPSETTYCRILS